MLPTGVPEYRVQTKPSLVEHWRHLAEIVALVTAAIWAFYVFVYQERIKPAGEPPRLQASANVTHEPLQGSRELVTINITLKNTGSNDIEVGALLVNAYGLRYRSGSAGVAQEAHPGDGIFIVNRGLERNKSELLYSHIVLRRPLGATAHAYIPQGEQVTFSMPFVVERGAYDTLRVNFIRCDQRADNPRVTSYAPKRTADGAFDVEDLVRQNDAHPGLQCGGYIASGEEFAL
jgi:hypothetical protein